MDIIQIVTVVEKLFSDWGYPIIFLGSLIETSPVGWLVPGGAILVVAGYLSSGYQTLPLIPIIIWGTLGTWAAFVLSYLLGSKTGMRVVEKFHQENNARFAQSLFRKHGGIILTTSMLSNLTRFWVAYIAGVENYNFLKFNFSAFIASISWVSLLVLLGYFTGYEIENLKKISGNAGIFSWAFLIIALTVIFITVKIEKRSHKLEEPLV